MSDKNNKADDLEAGFRKLVIDELRAIGVKQDTTSLSLGELKTELALHQQESNMRWQAIEKLDEEQNAILAEHRSTGLAQMEANKIARAELKAKIENLEPRVVKLEEPGKVMGTLKKWVLGAGAVAAAIMAICKFLGII